MPQQEEEDVLRFYVFLSPPDPDGNARRKFFTVDEADLVDGADVNFRKLDAVFPDGGRLSSNFPVWPGYCRVGHTLFLIGGMHCKERYADSDLVLSFDPTASPPPGDCSPSLSSWGVAGVMQRGRQRCVAIPYDGKIFIFGGVEGRNAFLEVYDPQSGNFLPPKEFPEDLGLVFPTSYFLWKDSRNPDKKPLIVLYCYYSVKPSRLYSYDVEGNCWELFDHNFPAPPLNFGPWSRNLIPLDCNDTLLLIDYAAHWSIYSLSSKKVVGEVPVRGLDLEKDQLVAHVFWRRCSDKGSMIFYIFTDGIEDEYQVCPNRIPYAKVRFLTLEEEFVATLESKGVLEVGKCVDICMFAEQIGRTKRTLEEAPFEGGGEHSKKIKL